MLVIVVLFFNIVILPEKLICHTKITYPTPERTDAENTYFGFTVKDPYQWMENAITYETKKFMYDENAITLPFLHSCPDRQDIISVLTERWNYSKFTAPEQHGDKFVFVKNADISSESVLYIQDSLETQPRVLLDARTLSPDGSVSLQEYGFSEDGLIFAYAVSNKGSDWRTVRFKHIYKGDIYQETLEKLKFTDVKQWTHDNKGLFYAGYLDQNAELDEQQQQKIYYHYLGTEQTQDVIVAEFPDKPDHLVAPTVSEDGKYLLVSTYLLGGNSLYFCDLTKTNGEITGKLELTTVVESTEYNLSYVTNIDSKFIFITNQDAPNSKVIIIDFNDLDAKKWKTLIEEHPSDALHWAVAVYHDYLVVNYIHNVKHLMQLRSIETGELVYTFPLNMHSVEHFSGKINSEHIFYSLTSFLTAGIVYHVDLSEQPIKPKVIREVQVPNFDPSLFVTEQIFYKSKDGTSIPMFLIHKKDFKKNGQSRCVLYSYGAFGDSNLPQFTVDVSFIIDKLNAVYAIANVRGGGEYGGKWQQAGATEHKQNSFDDFNAAAEYLIQHKFTSPQFLASNGASAGGLLVAACANQRPELYGAVLPVVGVYDMLRYQYFTAGNTWVTEYGSSEDDEATFKTLYAYSPLHNIPKLGDKCVQYPATFIVTGDHDDRVVPAHALKFAAELQYKLGNDPRQTRPLLLWIQRNVGHSGAQTKSGWLPSPGNSLRRPMNSAVLQERDT